MAVRLSRIERKARTRARYRGRARVFLRDGFHRATLDDIAEEAGYTKGAVYSNFSGKNALFLALLDAQFAAAARPRTSKASVGGQSGRGPACQRAPDGRDGPPRAALGAAPRRVLDARLAGSRVARGGGGAPRPRARRHRRGGRVRSPAFRGRVVAPAPRDRSCERRPSRAGWRSSDSSTRAPWPSRPSRTSSSVRRVAPAAAIRKEIRLNPAPGPPTRVTLVARALARRAWSRDELASTAGAPCARSSRHAASESPYYREAFRPCSRPGDMSTRRACRPCRSRR